MCAGAVAGVTALEVTRILTGPKDYEVMFDRRATELREEKEQLRRYALLTHRYELPVDIRNMIEKFNEKARQHDSALDASSALTQQQRAAWYVDELPLDPIESALPPASGVDDVPPEAPTAQPSRYYSPGGGINSIEETPTPLYQ